MSSALSGYRPVLAMPFGFSAFDAQVSMGRSSHRLDSEVELRVPDAFLVRS